MLPLFALLLAASPAASAQDRAMVLGKHAERLMAGRTLDLGVDHRHTLASRAVHHDSLLDELDVRMVQRFNGVKVFGGEAIAHMADGQIRAVTNHLVKSLQLDTTPTVEAAEALAIVHAALAPKGPYAYSPTVELVIAPHSMAVPMGRGFSFQAVETRVLAYHVHTELENGTEETAHTDFFVDARTGSILDRWDTLHHTAAKGTGRSQYSGSVTLDTNSTATGFEFRDMTRGTGGNATYNLNHGTSGTGTIFTDGDNIWGDGANYGGGSTTSDNGQTAAVDAAYGLQNTWDFYKNVFNRNGIDGNGTATYSRLHYGTAYDNAFWSDSCFCMTYGDGKSFKSLEAMDVIGHEMSHGVCARTANLTYRGESGGLNEANSDIFGTLVEFYARGANGTGSLIPNYSDIGGMIQTVGGAVPSANYLIGEQLETSAFPKPLRYMYKPSLDGSSPDAWSKTLSRLDVHYSSGPANHFFFLLAHGSQVDAFSGNTQSPMANGVTSITGLGNHKAGQIWYRALTKYMTSSTTYAGARTACLSAASDLFGAASVEYKTVALAWKAVNVQ